MTMNKRIDEYKPFKCCTRSIQYDTGFVLFFSGSVQRQTEPIQYLIRCIDGREGTISRRSIHD